MIVYSVMFYRPETGDEWLEGPWPESWQANNHAAENNTDCKRTVIRWQMLNATTVDKYDAPDSPGEVKP